MPLRTAFTDLVGIEAPILCGGMQYVGYAGMCAAVKGHIKVVEALAGRSADPKASCRLKVSEHLPRAR